MTFIAKYIVFILLIFSLIQCNRERKSHFTGDKHFLSDSNLIVLVDSISPDSNFRYLTYQSDNGGFGYSRVFWTVFKNTDETVNLLDTKIPDGYKINGWSGDNKFELEKWEPYYYKDKEVELKTDSDFNGIKLIVKK